MDNLPMGKYIVCAEARLDEDVVQNNCFETIVDRLDNNSKCLFLWAPYRSALYIGDFLIGACLLVIFFV